MNKPAGLVVHPASGHERHTLVNALLHHCGDELSGIGGVARPGIVHRLDKETALHGRAKKRRNAPGALRPVCGAQNQQNLSCDCLRRNPTERVRFEPPLPPLLTSPANAVNYDLGRESSNQLSE